jgi:hypothetical protein
MKKRSVGISPPFPPLRDADLDSQVGGIIMASAACLKIFFSRRR